jgi:uncharacterized membrane protein YjgN (DUF898 family)
MIDAVAAGGPANTSDSAPAARELPLEFRATGGEYFRIWIVNLLLTIVTIGIYSAWAKVRRLRYFYGSTTLDGSSFEYHGRAIAILKGRAIAVVAYLVFVIAGRISPLYTLLLMPLFIFGVPWVIMKARKFQTRMSAWRGLRFNFHGTYGGALGAFIGWGILASITLFILWPLALWKQMNYLLNNAAYGTERFRFTGRVGRFYGFCFATLGLLLAIIIVMSIVFTIVVTTNPDLRAVMVPGGNPRDVAKVLFGSAILFVLLAYVLTIMFLTAFFRASLINATIGGVEIGPHRVYSRLKTWPMFGILLTNLLAMVVTLGLFYPWAKVRTLRYQLANTGVIANGDLGQFVADTTAATNAVGQEVGEIFDIDFGF